MTRILIVGLLLSALCAAAAGAGNHISPLDNNAGSIEINGVRLTLADIEARKPALLFQARNTFYEAQRKAVEEFITDNLLEQQAAKEKVTVAELLQRHVNSAIAKDPPEEALRVYYEGLDVKEPFEAVREKITEVIRERRLAKAKAAYVQSLRSQANVSIRLAPPRAPLSIKDAPVRGVADAPVMVVEYADYECPYCQTIQPILDRLMAEYKGKMALVYKDTPLPMHANAQKAAEAAHCAGAQGKYWEYHDHLFQTKEYGIPNLKDGARKLELNGEAFDRCLDSGQTADLVKAQLMEAQSLGIPGTPAFFINGRFLNPNGNTTYETLRQIIDEELRASAAQAKQTARAGSE
jgi:protein-disulfide isomerase